MSSITQAEWRFKVTRSPPRFPRALSIFTEITGEGCLFGRSTLFHRLTLWPSSLSSLTSLGELTKFHLWRSCVRVCVCVAGLLRNRGKKEGKRRRGEEKGREEKECARHSHLPGRITRFRCCVRMSGTGGPCERALSFLPPDSEILPLLLYLFAFPPPPFFLFSFFDTAVALNAGERRRGLPRKGQLLARIGENEATDRTDATPLSFCRCMHGLMRLGRRKVAKRNVGKVVHDGSLSNEITRIGKTFIIREGKIFSSERGTFHVPPCKRVSLSTSFSIKRVNFGESLK